MDCSQKIREFRARRRNAVRHCMSTSTCSGGTDRYSAWSTNRKVFGSSGPRSRASGGGPTQGRSHSMSVRSKVWTPSASSAAASRDRARSPRFSSMKTPGRVEGGEAGAVILTRSPASGYVDRHARRRHRSVPPRRAESVATLIAMSAPAAGIDPRRPAAAESAAAVTAMPAPAAA